MMPEEERRQWQNPEAILTEIGLKPGMTFIDVGCGEGFFSLPAAKMVGVKGKVYALDINPEKIEFLRTRASFEGLANLATRVDEAENTVFCQACADIGFFGIVLHDFRDPAKVLSNAHRMLKPSGILANLDWKKESTPFGPPERIRFSEEEARHLIESQGFRVNDIRNSGLYHYLMIAVP